MNLSAFLGNTLWQAGGLWAHQRFMRDRERLRQVQEARLAQVLGRLQGTLFAQRYQINKRWTYHDFCREVPTHSYEDLVEYLAVPNGLLTEPVRVWEPTGGSTGGSKWIPWTAGLQAEFRTAVSSWVVDMFCRLPALKRGRSFWQLTPHTRVEAPAWLEAAAVGFATDGDYLGRWGRVIERLITVQPSRRTWDSTLQALRRASDLTFISCWSPSYLLELHRRASDWQPGKWWPRLIAISCWTDGPSACLVPRVKELFPGVDVWGKGLLSTEAVTTIPCAGRFPLAYHSHFFEFMSADGRVYPSWELSEGQVYSVLQTTSGGLVRYRSDDQVLVTSHWGEVPCLRFLARDGVSDQFGEKLSHAFLSEALSSLECFAALGFESGGYVLFLEDQVQGAERMRERLESRLKQVYTYRDCQTLGQLQPLRLFLMRGNGLEQLRHALGHHSGREKMPAILPAGAWSERVAGQFFR